MSKKQKQKEEKVIPIPAAARERIKSHLETMQLSKIALQNYVNGLHDSMTIPKGYGLNLQTMVFEKARGKDGKAKTP